MEPEVLTKVEQIDPVADEESKEGVILTESTPSPQHDLGGLDEDDDEEDSLSLYEGLLDAEDEPYDHVRAQDVCTPEEAKQFRQRLREVGLEAFVSETLGKETVSVQKLMTAFGVRIPQWVADSPPELCYRVLGMAMVRELQKRQRLPEYQTIDDAAKLLNASKKIMVVTGAGVSTSLGIPDFRSKSTGFYSKLQARGFQEPEEVFDLQTFDEDPSLFYSLAGDILPDLNKWTPTHQFIRIIQDKGKLLRNYTQNIDNIESHAGILPSKLIQCHGSWAHATCRKCGYKVPGEEIFENIRAKEVATCKRCEQTLRAPGGIKRKRTPNSFDKPKKRGDPSDDDDSDGQYDIPEPGVMKPDITFFGEKLPDLFFDTLQQHDRNEVDLVIVMGTSMKVAPVSEIPNYLPANVPQIYISRDPVYHINFDINLLGDCDTIVAALCERAGWDLKHNMIPSDLKVKISPHETLEHTYVVTAVSSGKEEPKEADSLQKTEVAA
ncbi:uncharacterized protein PV09_02389 [Verruconis gallopava]|uniref:Deacetylase sirtuin-type domain-containing protein n=1 Tax=Verruconis gallopava TaxID=253628 RepID=A0A0D2B623_9PEZI|nr:uncharacterized protein PV09_02389 [Verruconis gallopava]KIW06684.1 hypothetical protein PV09_02389 [Verruconis gallopava]